MTTPSARSSAHFKKLGAHVFTLEKWVTWVDPKTGKTVRMRKDIMGCDLLVVIKGDRPILVQSTTLTNFPHRQRKLEDIPELRLWLPWCRVQVHGWWQSKENNRWHLRAEELVMLKTGIYWDEAAAWRVGDE
jgi:hypothetical protein